MTTATWNLLTAGCASLASVLGLVAWLRARRVGVSTAASADLDDTPTSGWRRLVAPISIHLRPTVPDELAQLETRLQMAGRRSREAVDRFNEERVIAILGGMVGALVLASMLRGLGGLLVSLGALVLGLLGPGKSLALRADERGAAISAALPAALDLLTTCIDAGLSLEHALARVAREITPTSPILGTEFGVTANEFEAGVPLADALRRLARRVGLDDLSALCGVLAQAHRLGAPVGNTLREFAAASRRNRMGQLEERAGKLAAQMTVPLSVCLMPSAMLIILGPAILQLVRALQ